MVKIILIVVKRAYAQLQSILDQKSACSDINDPRFHYQWQECGKYGMMLYLQFPAPEAEEPGVTESFISSFLSRFIIHDLRDFLFQDILRFNYFYLSKAEQDEICLQARRNLERGLIGHRHQAFGEIIDQKIREYLFQHNNYLNVEGFIYFRLQDYQLELKQIVDEAVENYLTEKEYREFIRLLKYFLEIQQPKIDLVHLAVDESGQFQITDQRLKKIDPRDWEEFDLDELEKDSDYEDILVSMLVSVAPRRIMLHQNVLPRYPKTVETLRRIFAGRLILCHNCAYCRQEVKHLVNIDKPK
jgi:putative sporulation protein YtxC